MGQRGEERGGKQSKMEQERGGIQEAKGREI